MSADAALEADLALLCRSCGLCCDGSLFGRVDLAPEEVAPARRHHLHILQNAKGFEQPCSALTSSDDLEAHTCSIYEERPASCRRFICRLHDRHQRERGPIEARISVVRRVRQLFAHLESSGLGPADLESIDANTEHADPATESARRAYLELMQSLEDDFARAR